MRGIPLLPRAINNAYTFLPCTDICASFRLFYLLYTHTEQYPIPNDDLFRLLLLSLFIRIIQVINLTTMPFYLALPILGWESVMTLLSMIETLQLDIYSSKLELEDLDAGELVPFSIHGGMCLEFTFRRV